MNLFDLTTNFGPDPIYLFMFLSINNFISKYYLCLDIERYKLRFDVRSKNINYQEECLSDIESISDGHVMKC